MNPSAQRLKWLREQAGFNSLRTAAEAYAIGYEIYKKLASGERNLTIEHAEAIARWHGVSRGWIMFGEGTPEGETLLPVRGCIGAGQEMILFEDVGETSWHVDAVLAQPDAMALEVRGDSMFPLARDRDVIFVGAPQRDLKRLIGKECAVVLQDGRRFFKVLEHGTRTHLFDLRSYNAEPIRDVEVHTAYPFLGLRRR
jgi:hypothetical protein